MTRIIQAASRWISRVRSGRIGVDYDGGRMTNWTISTKLFTLAAIGIVQESEYEEMVIDIEPGDRVYFHSDGINEERNPDAEQFGRQRLGAALHELQGVSLNESLDALVRRIIAWRGDDCFSDDLSILAFELGA